MDSTDWVAKSASQRIASVIDALGTDRFEDETLRLLHERSGVDHYCVYRLRNEIPEFLGGASVRGTHAMRHNPHFSKRRSYAELIAAREATKDLPGALFLRDAITQLDDRTLRSALRHHRIIDRAMVCGRATDDLYAVTMLRSEDTGRFAGDELDWLSESGDILIAACAKHATIHWDRAHGVKNFDSVKTIEDNLRRVDWGMSPRELQVGARILYGISTTGMAIDLELGAETIATYRKRLYARLEISGRHELLQRYLALF